MMFDLTRTKVIALICYYAWTRDMDSRVCWYTWRYMMKRFDVVLWKR